MTTVPTSLTYSSMLSGLPAEWDGEPLREKIFQINQTRGKKVIVLDDDPTGVQTVHDIFVLTQWSTELLRAAFQRSDTLFYILTNTRGYEASVAEQRNREIVRNVYTVARETGVDFVLVSRSDSTLRGYYPLEIDVLSDEIKRLTGQTFDGHCIIPAFFEGGRLTFQNTHYIRENDALIPLQETEFAQDKVFGYAHSDLTRWVEEKTEGRVKAKDCISISLEELRQGPDAIEKKLLDVKGNTPVIVNCLSYGDLDVFSLALLQAEARGKKFIYRTAASFVKSYAGMENQAYLEPAQFVAKGQEAHGGLVIVGSYVQKTTRQLTELLRGSNIVPVEMHVAKILDAAQQAGELKRIGLEVNQHLLAGENVVVFSSRELVAMEDKTANLRISQTISMALVEIVRLLEVTPKFMIAKGGITSSDVATEGLGIREARVIGQVSAGIPVWLTGREAKFSGIPYIVFPGNVGNDQTLLEIVQKIQG